MSVYETILAIDFDRHAADTYRANFPGVEVRCASVAKEASTLPYADVIVGGPPCQPFSTAGKGKGNADARDCVPDFCAAIERVKPRMFLMENVDGMVRAKFARYLHSIVKRMEAAGYMVQIRDLDAVSFGVPQFRLRWWFWGIRRDVYQAGARHLWPTPTHTWPTPADCMFGGALLPGVTVGEALGLDGHIRRARAASVERRDHPTTEPCPTLCDGSGGSGGVLRYRCLERPSPTLVGGSSKSHTNGKSVVNDVDWREEFERVPEMVRVHDPKHPTHRADQPGVTLRGGGDGHSAPDHTTLLEIIPPRQTGCPASFSIDEPSRTIVATRADEWKLRETITVDTKQHRTERPIDEPSTTVAHDCRRHLKAGGIYVRRLTPLECLRLQSGPDDFRWPEKISKTAQYKIVGNGVACKIAWHLSRAFAKADPESRTVISLFCGGGLLDCGWHGRFWSYGFSTKDGV